MFDIWRNYQPSFGFFRTMNAPLLILQDSSTLIKLFFAIYTIKSMENKISDVIITKQDKRTKQDKLFGATYLASWAPETWIKPISQHRRIICSTQSALTLLVDKGSQKPQTKTSNESKRNETTTIHRPVHRGKTSNLDVVDNLKSFPSSSIASTTRHPRWCLDNDALMGYEFDLP